MQNRMKNHQLTKESIAALLQKTLTGSMATLNTDGSPYVLPVHFVFLNDYIYIHGLSKGRKISNIKKDPRVSLTIYEMVKLLLNPDEKPCDTNTEYQSVVINGTASIVSDIPEKLAVLKEILKKYTPQLLQIEMPNNMIKATTVIKVKIETITGKCYS